MFFKCHVCGKTYEGTPIYGDTILGGVDIDGVYHKYLSCREHKRSEIRAAFNAMTGLNYPPIEGNETCERKAP